MKYLLFPILLLSTIPVQAQDNGMDFYNKALENVKQYHLEQTMTQPEDALDQALAEFWNDGSNDTTEQEVLLQLPSSRD